MNKSNVFRSSEFHMAEGDILHMLIKEEIGVTADIRLVSGGDTANVDEVPDAPIALDASDITGASFTANWHFMENTSGFYLDVATDEDFTAFVVGYENLDVGYVNEYPVVGLLGLVPYYYRLRGYNDIGTGVDSNTITLTTLYTPVYDFDGNVYTYVTIGTQQWLVENLITTHYDDGVAIPNLTLDADWIAEDGTAGHDGAYCWYNNDAVTYADYGCLYNWYAVDNAHGLAPAGWRIPTDVDFDTLVAYSGGDLLVGGKLKETGITHWLTPNTGATNEYAFYGRGSGYRTQSGTFFFLGTYGWLRMSTETAPTIAEYFRMEYDSAEGLLSSSDKRFGYSIRCVRDI